MKHRSSFIVFTVLFVWVTLLPFDASGGTYAVFGPEVYTRGTGSPVTVAHTFAALNETNTCTLRIHNGGLEDSEYERVSSSIIILNGVQVVGPSEFNQNVDLIEKFVTINTDNTLSVEVRGKPGGTITIVVDCPVLITVPNLFGLSEAEAEAALAEAGLGIGTISQKYAVILPTGAVINQDPPPGTVLDEGTAVDLVLVQPPPAEEGEGIGDIWAGEWQITITSMNPADNAITAADQTLVMMCTGDPAGWTLIEHLADASTVIDYGDCNGEVLDNHIASSCSFHATTSSCSADVDMQIEMDVYGDTLVGTGQWIPSADCILPSVSNGESFTLFGKRQTMAQPASCDSPTSSLIQKLMPYLLKHIAESMP